MPTTNKTIPRCPPFPFPLPFPKPPGRVQDVKAKTTDSQLKLNVSQKLNQVQINGFAKGDGKLVLNFDGKTVRVPLSKGMSPTEVTAAVNKALPDGYRLRQQPVLALIHPSPSHFQIVKRRPANDPQAVTAGFNRAQKSGTDAGKKVSARELRQIVNKAKADGFTAKEKQAVAQAWAATFDGSKFNATKEAQELYAALKEKHDLPTLWIR